MKKEDLIQEKTYLRRHKHRMYAGDAGRGSILSERKFAEIEG